MVPDFLLQASGANLLASQNKLLAPDSLFVLSRLNLSPHPFFIASGLVFVNLSVPFSLSDSDKEILVGSVCNKRQRRKSSPLPLFLSHFFCLRGSNAHRKGKMQSVILFTSWQLQGISPHCWLRGDSAGQPSLSLDT